MNPLAVCARKSGYWQLPGSLLRGALSFGKSFVTWEGRDVSQINDAEFLRKGVWEENMNLLSNAIHKTSVTALMTKDVYRWQPKETYISAGFDSVQKQKEAQASRAFIRWLQIGAVGGVAYLFFKAMQFNFHCLGELSERDCRILYGERISQPAMVAQIAVASCLWSLGGLLLNNLGDFGLRGFIQERKLTRNLFSIYRNTADSARTAFWNAVDRQDQVAARKIYGQVQSIKNASEYIKSANITNLGLSADHYAKMIRPFNLLIEDLLSQDIGALFLRYEVKKEIAGAAIASAANRAIDVPKKNEEEKK